MMRRALILGCVPEQGREPAPARQLFTGLLWTARRAYAEASGQPWFIFSALYGWLQPGRVVAPYRRGFEVAAWGWREKLSAEACGRIVGEGFREVEIHADQSYVADLVPMLGRFGVNVFEPVKGLGVEEQLHWYAERKEGRASA